jgi:hypothetical protein
MALPEEEQVQPSSIESRIRQETGELNSMDFLS